MKADDLLPERVTDALEMLLKSDPDSPGAMMYDPLMATFAGVSRPVPGHRPSTIALFSPIAPEEAPSVSEMFAERLGVPAERVRVVGVPTLRRNEELH